MNERLSTLDQHVPDTDRPTTDPSDVTSESEAFVDQARRRFVDYSAECDALLAKGLPRDQDPAPNRVGFGKDCVVMASTEHPDVVLKVNAGFADGARTPTGQHDETQIDVLFRSQGIPRVEQLVALNDGVRVTTRMSGARLDEFDDDHLFGQITPKHVEALIETLRLVVDRGLTIEPEPGNVLFDPSMGFSLIDIEPNVSEQSVLEVLSSLIRVLKEEASYEGNLPGVNKLISALQACTT